MQEKTIISDQVVNEGTAAYGSGQKSNRFSLNRKDSIFRFIICAAVILLTFFGIFGGFKAGFTVTSLVLFAVMTAYFANTATKIRIFPLLCGILNCLIALSFGITSNFAINFFSAISMMLLSAVWFISLVSPPEKEGDFTLVKKITLPFVFGTTVNLPKSTVAFFTFKKLSGGKSGKVFLGIVFAIPVLVIVVPLMMASDAAFNGLINLMFGDIFVNLFKIIIGFGIALFVVSYCFTLKKQDQPNSNKLNVSVIDNTISVSFLAVLSVCYLVYLFSQLAYFFRAFGGLLPENYTLAEYARRGFFEMSIIAVINFFIIYCVLVFTRKKHDKVSIAARILCTFISIFTLVIIATALSKMFLYIQNYGMTQLRIFTSTFMIFLSVVFISIILRIYIARIKVLKVIFISAGLMFFVLGTFNMDGVIADYNYTAYKTGALDEIDVSTIYRLGDEGVEYLVKLADDGDADVAEQAREYIKDIIYEGRYHDVEVYGSYYIYYGTCEVKGEKYQHIWQYNYARARACEALDNYIEENPEILEPDQNYF